MKNLIIRIRRTWSDWSQRSVNRRIFAASVTIGGLTGCVNVASFLKELMVAHRFGTSDDLDAFLIAFLLPNFAINVVAGSFSSAFIPMYVSVKEREGDKAAQRLFSSVSIWSLAVLGFACIVLGLSFHAVLPYIASGFSGEKLALTESLFFALLPVIIASGVVTLWSSLLNASEQFAVAAIAPAAVPLVTMVSLFAYAGTYGIYSLAIGAVAGFCVQIAVLMVSLRKREIPLLPRWHGMSPHFRGVISQYLPMAAGAFLLSGTGLVDRAMAATLGTGSVSVLSYANKVVAVVVGLGTLALGTAVLPHFSLMVAKEDWRGIRHTIKTYVRLLLWTTIPIVIFLTFVSRPIIELVFERGRFTHSDTILVARVQTFYFLQVPFYALSILFIRLISSLKQNKTLLWGATVSFPVNILLNIIFMRWMGVAGIALSTSVVYLISCIYLGSMFVHHMRDCEKRSHE